MCTLQCQLTVCAALSGFFRLTYNDSMPWPYQHARDWSITRMASCKEIIMPTAEVGQPPPYCSWYGITCCRQTDVTVGVCSAVHAVANLTLQAQNLNSSYSDPLMDALERLHACGLMVLDLESNELTGGGQAVGCLPMARLLPKGMWRGLSGKRHVFTHTQWCMHAHQMHNVPMQLCHMPIPLP